MMPGPKRCDARADWPIHLYVRNRGGAPYYFWRHPKTKREFGLGRDLVYAIAQSTEANAKIASENAKDTGRIARKVAAISHEKICATAVPVDGAWAGVYFLVLGDVVVYVGKSTNVGARLREHKRDNVKTFDRVAHIQCDASELDHLEKVYITKLKPKHNLTGYR
jgi:hypothetical protein